MILTFIIHIWIKNTHLPQRLVSMWKIYVFCNLSIFFINICNLKCHHRQLGDQLVSLAGLLYFELILKLTITLVIFFIATIPTVTCKLHNSKIDPRKTGRQTYFVYGDATLNIWLFTWFFFSFFQWSLF